MEKRVEDRLEKKQERHCNTSVNVNFWVSLEIGNALH
jgi:hypothetical protein